MKIDRIETFVLKAPLAAGEGFYWSQAGCTERASLLVKITTDSGLVGWGESGVSMPVDHLQSYTHDILAARLMGRDASATEPIWHDLYGFSRDFGRKGASVDAMSGVDIALWDLRGKEAGRPIHALMGGAFRDRVRSYATGLYYRGKDVRDVRAALKQVRTEARGFVQRGFTAIKGKIGLLPWRDDLRRMEVLREEVGADFLLMTDANHAYNFPTAQRMGEALQALGFHWFEEPLVPEDIAGCAELRRKLSIAIATGECEYGRCGFLDLLRAGAADILQPDLCRCGGLTEGQKILALATAYHTPVCLHVWGSGIAIAAGLQLTAIIPPIPHTVFPVAPENEPMLEFDRNPNPLRDELLTRPFTLDGEAVRIPQGPGLGVEINRGTLKRFTVSYRSTKR
jgi:D-galactarolactone cycloisomerase